MKRFFMFTIIALALTPFGTVSFGADAAECGNAVSHFISPGDMAGVLFVVSGNLDADEIKDLDIPSIKSDIRLALHNAGIQSGITENPEDLSGDRFLKIHIYGILLERRVYFCSVAVIQHRPKPQADCTVREYSDVTSRIGNIRSQVRALMSDLLRDVH